MTCPGYAQVPATLAHMLRPYFCTDYPTKSSIGEVEVKETVEEEADVRKLVLG